MDISPFFDATDTPVFHFCWCFSWVSKHLHSTNSSVSHLVWHHLLTDMAAKQFQSTYWCMNTRKWEYNTLKLTFTGWKRLVPLLISSTQEHSIPNKLIIWVTLNVNSGCQVAFLRNTRWRINIKDFSMRYRWKITPSYKKIPYICMEFYSII